MGMEDFPSSPRVPGCLWLSLCLVPPPGPLLTSLSLFFAANDGSLREWLSGRVMVLEDNIQFINIGFCSSPLLPPLGEPARLGNVI